MSERDVAKLLAVAVFLAATAALATTWFGGAVGFLVALQEHSCPESTCDLSALYAYTVLGLAVIGPALLILAAFKAVAGRGRAAGGSVLAAAILFAVWIVLVLAGS